MTAREFSAAQGKTMASVYASIICATVAGLYYAGAIVSLWSEINDAFAPVFGG